MRTSVTTLEERKVQLYSPLRATTKKHAAINNRMNDAFITDLNKITAF